MNPKKLLDRLRDYRRKERQLHDPLNNLIESIEYYVSSIESGDKKSISKYRKNYIKDLKKFKIKYKKLRV